MNSQKIQAVISDFMSAYQTCQAALNKESSEEQAAIETRHTQSVKLKERNIAIARNLATQNQIKNLRKLQDATKIVTDFAGNILDVAEYICIGKSNLRGKDYGINEDFDIPIVVPFIGQGNIFIHTNANEINSLCSNIMCETLQKTAAGQLQIIAYDPALTGALAPFSSLEKGMGLMHVLTGKNDLDDIFEDVVATNRNTMNITKGAEEGLVSFRNAVNQPVGTLKLIVLLDFPRGLSEQNHLQLYDLLAQSPKNGVSFLIFCKNDEMIPEWLDMRKIITYTQYFKRTIKEYIWVNRQNLPVILNSAFNLQKTISIADEIIKRSLCEAVPTISLTDIEDVHQTWKRTTANELSFVIGKEGLNIIEVNLADELKGTYNAIISGAVGQGKSNLIKMIIYSLCSRYSPDELNLFLLDFKEGVTLYPFSNLGSPDFLPHAKVLGLESDRDFGLAVLKYLEKEFLKRSVLIKPYGDKLAQYRAANPGKKMPRIVLVIDEFHFMFNSNDEVCENAANILESLARKGRAYGIHLILASQTVSGASALLLKEDGIMGQIPIRIALKNSIQESYSTFMQGNDGAARLRVRGQAVINCNYGALGDNTQFTVAHATDEELNTIRVNWWNRSKDKTSPPIVFSGTDTAQLSTILKTIRNAREKISNGNASSKNCYIGLPITVDREPLSISLTAVSGRNIALIGAGENTDYSDSYSNMAIGIMQSIAVSLALQHPNGDARFIVFEQLDANIAEKNGFQDWMSLMSELGFPIEVVPDGDVSEVLAKFVEKLHTDAGSGETFYIFGFAMDRAKGISRQDPISSLSGLDSFREILRDGPMNNIHFIGAWTNVNTYQNHLGFGNDGCFETKIILRLNEASTQTILGPFVHWSVKDNRALVSDVTQLQEPVVIVPFMPITRDIINKIRSFSW